MKVRRETEREREREREREMSCWMNVVCKSKTDPYKGH